MPFYAIKMQNIGKKTINNNYFSIFRKNSTKVYVNPTFCDTTFCNDLIVIDVVNDHDI